MSGFRSHRSRFRREKLTDQANNQEQNSVFSSSLGRVGVQGVESLWGDFRFIPADWGSK